MGFELTQLRQAGLMPRSCAVRVSVLGSCDARAFEAWEWREADLGARQLHQASFESTLLRPEGFELSQLHQAGLGATQPRQAMLESAQSH